MMSRQETGFFLRAIVVPLALTACWACSGSGAGGEGGSETDAADSSAAADADADADSDGDGDGDTDADSDGDTGTETETDTETDTDSDSDTDSGTGSDTDSGAPDAGVDWLTWIDLPPGSFRQGNEDPNSIYNSETPAHKVTLRYAFALTKTEVTVGEYRRCVEAKRCTVPFDKDPMCNYYLAEREDHPVNCVDFSQAEAFCAFVGARLPSESEWEYAARSGGQESTFISFLLDGLNGACPQRIETWKDRGVVDILAR